MKQRNGRIDRTLQPSPEVRCHYFSYPQRREDAVLDTLVAKVAVIQKELGSLGTIVLERFAETLQGGIDDATHERLEKAESVRNRSALVKDELETQRIDKARLRQEIDDAGQILNESRRVMDFDPVLLRDALNVGLELSGAKPLSACGQRDGPQAFELPALSDAWAQTLDTVRPPREREESFWEWRKRKPLPVVFEPPEHMASGLVHLHLQHPLVQRLLSRFLAQGYSAHDLSRVTVVRNAKDSMVRVLAFGRLSLFGPGAVRLHDEIVSVAAPWLEGGGPKHLRPFAEEADRRAIETLETVLAQSPDLSVSTKVQERLVRAAPSDFATLWKHIADEADAKAALARARLNERANQESEDLRAIIARQMHAIEVALKSDRQLDDGTVYFLLGKLLVLDGQRLSYRTLDVEQIGSVYEALMGYHVQRLAHAAVCLRPDKARAVWVCAAHVVKLEPRQRAKWLQHEAGLTKGVAERVAAALADEVSEDKALALLADFRIKGTDVGRPGALVVQPGQERKRTSSHYTPRSLRGPRRRRSLRRAGFWPRLQCQHEPHVPEHLFYNTQHFGEVILPSAQTFLGDLISGAEAGQLLQSLLLFDDGRAEQCSYVHRDGDVFATFTTENESFATRLEDGSFGTKRLQNANWDMLRTRPFKINTRLIAGNRQKIATPDLAAAFSLADDSTLGVRLQTLRAPTPVLATGCIVGDDRGIIVLSRTPDTLWLLTNQELVVADGIGGLALFAAGDPQHVRYRNRATARGYTELVTANGQIPGEYAATARPQPRIYRVFSP